jgi:hypothetical protein
LAKLRETCRRKSTVPSPIGEVPEDVLAKVWWTFANGETPIGENFIGEIPEPLFEYTKKIFHFI